MAVDCEYLRIDMWKIREVEMERRSDLTCVNGWRNYLSPRNYLQRGEALTSPLES
jgi:hypothetical protein